MYLLIFYLGLFLILADYHAGKETNTLQYLSLVSCVQLQVDQLVVVLDTTSQGTSSGVSASFSRIDGQLLLTHNNLGTSV